MTIVKGRITKIEAQLIKGPKNIEEIKSVLRQLKDIGDTDIDQAALAITRNGDTVIRGESWDTIISWKADSSPYILRVERIEKEAYLQGPESSSEKSNHSLPSSKSQRQEG